MKKRDLKLDSQLTEIDKREEGEIAGEEWRKGGIFKILLLRPFNSERTVNWDERPGEQGFDFMIPERKMLVWKSKKKEKKKRRPKAKKETRNFTFAAPSVSRRHIKVLDGCHTGCAPFLQLFLRPRSLRWQHESKCWVHFIHSIPTRWQTPDLNSV